MRLKNNYNQISIFDLIYKFNYNNYFQIPKIKNIHVNVNDLSLISNKNKIFDYLYFLELLTNKKAIFSISNKTNVTLKIRKKSIIGCYVHLNKNQCFTFLEILILFVLPLQKNFLGIGLKSTNQTSFVLKDWFSCLPKNTNYNFIFYKNELKPLQIQIKFSKIKNIKQGENICLLSSLNFPIYQI